MVEIALGACAASRFDSTADGAFIVYQGVL
jgi:hypothetical protein